MINKLSSLDYEICHTQEKIYKYMVEQGYNLKDFSDAYLSCDFCKKNMDTIYSRFQIEFPDECADFYMPEIGNKLSKTTGKYDYFAGEIGFMYRLLYVETSIPSAELVKRIPFDKLAEMAHTFEHYGYEEIADDIIEKFHLSRKRYDNDFVPLTDEQLAEMEYQIFEEHRQLEKKYL
ncbi:MAG: hypothetical protein K2K02_05330 [Ruminococcus sp.]|nr:hypothetical protein [Ruminococcus sp.]